MQGVARSDSGQLGFRRSRTRLQQQTRAEPSGGGQPVEVKTQYGIKTCFGHGPRSSSSVCGRTSRAFRGGAIGGAWSWDCWHFKCIVWCRSSVKVRGCVVQRCGTSHWTDLSHPRRRKITIATVRGIAIEEVAILLRFWAFGGRKVGGGGRRGSCRRPCHLVSLSNSFEVYVKSKRQDPSAG